jgi:hypothetical protein
VDRQLWVVVVRVFQVRMPKLAVFMVVAEAVLEHQLQQHTLVVLALMV